MKALGCHTMNADSPLESGRREVDVPVQAGSERGELGARQAVVPLLQLIRGLAAPMSLCDRAFPSRTPVPLSRPALKRAASLRTAAMCARHVVLISAILGDGSR